MKGFSLIELLVGVLLAMIGVLVVMQTFANSENFKRRTVSENDLQSAAHTAIFLMERDIKSSGFGFASGVSHDCPKAEHYWFKQRSPNTPLGDLAMRPVQILVGAEGDSDALLLTSGTSQIRTTPAQMISTYTGLTDLIEVKESAAFFKGDVILLAQGEKCALLDVSDRTVGQLRVQAGAEYPHNPPAMASTLPAFHSGTYVFNLGKPRLLRFFVSDGRLLVQDLYAAAKGDQSIQVLAANVLQLRFAYGVDTDGDGSEDAFTRESPVASQDWKRVKSLRMALLLRSANYEKPEKGPCTATTSIEPFMGIKWGVPDGLPSCYRYRVFSSQVPLRNEIWKVEI